MRVRAGCFAVAMVGLSGPAAAWEEPRSVRESEGPVADLQLVDLDGDGDLDIVAVTGGEAGSVAWYANPGDGGGVTCDGSETPPGAGIPFGWEGTRIGDIASAAAVRVGDIDGDGDLDVMVDSAVTAGLRWYANVDLDGPGSGDGSTWEAASFGGFNQLDGPRLVDFDGDGDLDVFAFVFPASHLSWFEQTDDAWVEHIIVVAFPEDHGVVRVADLDDDGDLDVVLSRNVAEDLAWYENQGGSWLVRSIRRVAADSIELADIDGDGLLDIVEGPQNFGNARWHENRLDQEGLFVVRPVLLSPDVTAVAPADADGDGDVDIYVGLGGESPGLALFENAGDLSFVERRLSFVTTIQGLLRPGDLDGDGDVDVVGGSSVGLDWWNPATSARRTLLRSVVSAPMSQPAVGDFDGDGDGDIAMAVAGSHSLLVFENRGDAWAERCVDSDALRIATLRAADLDGDGAPELAAQLVADGSVAWWRREAAGEWTRRELGDGFFAPGLGVGPGWAALRFADVDDDGALDALAAGSRSSAGGNFWYRNEGAGEAWPRQSLPSNRVADFDVADVDRDGDPDVLGVFNSSTGWALNQGDGWAVEEAAPWSYGLTGEQRAADLDGDRDVDVLRAGWWGDDGWTVDVLRNDGDGWTAGVSLGAAHPRAIIDVEGDGRAEVLAGQDGTSRIFHFEDDLGRFSLTALGGRSPHAYGVGDVDGDGVDDVVVVDPSGFLEWIRNDAEQLPPLQDDDDAADDDDATDDDDAVEPDPPSGCDAGCGGASGGVAGALLLLPLGRRLRRRRRGARGITPPAARPSGTG